jgi:hypothetical protein
MGIDFIVLRFAPMNRFHIECVTQDKGDPFSGTEVGEPVPGEHTLDADHEIVAVRGENKLKRFGGGGQIFMDEFRAILIQDTDVHRLRM